MYFEFFCTLKMRSSHFSSKNLKFFQAWIMVENSLKDLSAILYKNLSFSYAGACAHLPHTVTHPTPRLNYWPADSQRLLLCHVGCITAKCCSFLFVLRLYCANVRFYVTFLATLKFQFLYDNIGLFWGFSFDGSHYLTYQVVRSINSALLAIAFLDISCQT